MEWELQQSGVERQGEGARRERRSPQNTSKPTLHTLCFWQRKMQTCSRNGQSSSALLNQSGVERQGVRARQERTNPNQQALLFVLFVANKNVNVLKEWSKLLCFARFVDWLDIFLLLPDLAGSGSL